MLFKWLKNMSQRRKAPPPVRRTLPRVPRIIAIVGERKEVEAMSWLLAGLMGDNYTFAVGSGEHTIDAVIRTNFGVSSTSEAPDMYLGVSGAELAANLRGALDANHPQIWAANLEKIINRLRPDVFVLAHGVESEVSWARASGAAVIATPSYGGDDEHLRVDGIDEDTVSAAVETLVERGFASSKARKVALK
jgi:hypothetical protein